MSDHDLTLYLHPAPAVVAPETGVGRVILAQAKYLPAFGVRLVDDPRAADVIACHIMRPEHTPLPRIDVLHTHGLYFSDVPHENYRGWHHNINRAIIETAREARAVTVPSDWVGEVFRRDMRISPDVIGHGIDPSEWQPGAPNLGYVLWNKNRATDVCDPTPAVRLAEAGIEVLSTFAPLAAAALPGTMRITGLLTAAQMQQAVRHAGAYLATTLETFGIGTLEALAMGIPVLGWRWGATPEIVRHGVEGYLVEPGDTDGLIAGLQWIRDHRAVLSANARKRASQYSWEAAAEQYALLYQRVLAERKADSTAVSVVIPLHNYAQYLPDAVASVQAQTCQPAEIIIVDDASTDNPAPVLAQLADADARVRVITHERNLGVAASRNDGIRAASCAFVVCLDADDRLDPRYLEVCLQALAQDRSLGIAYTSLRIDFENGETGYSGWPPEYDFQAMATPSVPPSNCVPTAAMFRKAMWERAGGYQQRWAPGEDAEFWLRGAAVGYGGQRVSTQPLFWYRVHGGSASRTKQYIPIDSAHPWMRDKQYPMAAPGQRRPVVRSYALPAVSVIIPVGPGHARYLPAALDSLLSQTFRAWEAVVVNDTGQPLPADTLRPYPFARVITTAGCTGAGAARNFGLAHARAPLTIFLDADDGLMPEAIQAMLEKYASSGGRYVYTDWIAASSEGTHSNYELDEYDPQAWVQRLVAGTGGLNAVTVLIDTTAARQIGFDENLPGWEDSDFFARCAVAGLHGVRLAQPLLVYSVDTGTRRAAAQMNKSRLLKDFQQRYGIYARGEKPMAGCCGGNGDGLLAAKRALDNALPVPESESVLDGPEYVKMEFTGLEMGTVPYQGTKGVYRGANTPVHRFASVHREDVAMLERTGKWKRVAAPQPVAVTAPAPVVDTATIAAQIAAADDALAAPAVEAAPAVPDPLVTTGEPAAAPVKAPKRGKAGK